MILSVWLVGFSIILSCISVKVCSVSLKNVGCLRWDKKTDSDSMGNNDVSLLVLGNRACLFVVVFFFIADELTLP